MREDAELLRCYVGQGSEPAFAEIVRRHLNLVYSVALRQVAGDAHLAEDVAQRVFSDLARKAEAVSRCSSLSGWLYRSTHFAASDAVRVERRRKSREQEALLMNTPDESSASVDWDRVRPVLDAAIAGLAERDRDAVSLRFLDGRSFADIGVRLSLTENAARMRVERALDKLHAELARRGISSTTAAVGVALVNQVSVAAPAGLATAIAGAVPAGGASAGGAALLGLFIMSKITTGIGAVVLISLALTGVVGGRENRALRAEVRELSATPPALPALQKESATLTGRLKELAPAHPGAAELVRLQARIAVLEARPPGVLDEMLVKASEWRNAGRETVEAANETLHWAMYVDDADVIASFQTFDDATPANREAFMARFSPAVRNRYRTPEGIVAAAFFGAGQKGDKSADDAMQVLRVGDGDAHLRLDRFGQKNIEVWYSSPSGREWGGGSRWKRTSDGWALAPESLAKLWQPLQFMLDPVSGDRIPPPQMPIEARARR